MLGEPVTGRPKLDLELQQGKLESHGPQCDPGLRGLCAGEQDEYTLIQLTGLS